MRIARLKKESQAFRRGKNISKHLRIAEATTGVEREKHLAAAEKLIERYKTLDEQEAQNKN